MEKYRGLFPPGSIWFKLNRDEVLALLKQQGQLEKMTPEEIGLVDSADIMAEKGKVEELEKMMTEAGLKIITLFD